MFTSLSKGSHIPIKKPKVASIHVRTLKGFVFSTVNLAETLQSKGTAVEKIPAKIIKANMLENIGWILLAR